MSIASEPDGGDGIPAAKDRYAGLATLLRSRREALGISRRDLAAATGLSYPYVAQLEGGYRAPSVTTARRLADALRLPVEEIVHAAGESRTTAPSPPVPALHVTVRDERWLANPAYAPSIGEMVYDAEELTPPAAPADAPSRATPAQTEPAQTEPAVPQPPAASTVLPPAAAAIPAPAPLPRSVARPTRPTAAVPPPAAAVPTPVDAPPPAAAVPHPVDAPASQARTPPSKARQGFVGRRRRAPEPSGPSGAAATPPAPGLTTGPNLGLTPETTPGSSADPVTETAEQITALLRSLPAADRLDALAAAQRDVMAQIVEDRIQGSRPSEA